MRVTITLLALFIIVIMLISIRHEDKTRSAVPDCVDLRAAVWLRYQTSKGEVYVHLYLVKDYKNASQVPMLYVVVEVKEHNCAHTYSGYLFLHNRTMIDEGLGWYKFPLQIPRGLQVEDHVLLYSNLDFKITGYRILDISLDDGRRYSLKCLVLRRGEDIMFFDSFSGVFIKGDLRIGERKLYAMLKGTNLVWRTEQYRFHVDWYKLREYAKEMNNTIVGGVKVIVKSIGRSVLGRDIYAFILNIEGSYAAVVLGGVHGSEIVSSTVSMRLVREFLEYKELLKLLASNRMKLVVIPMLNPDGVEAGKIMPEDYFLLYSRANARLIDLNRNFPYRLSYTGGESRACTLIHSEIHPLPEPEVKALMKFLLTIDNMVFFMDIHSGALTKVVIYPLGVRGLDYLMRDLAENVASVIQYDCAFTGPIGQSYWWVYGALKRPALLLEVYRGEDSYFEIYNPSNEEEIENIVQEVVKVLRYIIDNKEFIMRYLEKLSEQR